MELRICKPEYVTLEILKNKVEAKCAISTLSAILTHCSGTVFIVAVSLKTRHK